MPWADCAALVCFAGVSLALTLVIFRRKEVSG
jgi:hypothetical protein